MNAEDVFDAQGWPRCGLNGDWSVTAWWVDHGDPEGPNRFSGDRYVIDTEDPDTGFALVARYYDSDGYSDGDGNDLIIDFVTSTDPEVILAAAAQPRPTAPPVKREWYSIYDDAGAFDGDKQVRPVGNPLLRRDAFTFNEASSAAQALANHLGRAVVVATPFDSAFLVKPKGKVLRLAE